MKNKQKIVAKIGNSIQTLELPPAETEVIPGVLWGEHTHLFTPACWATWLWCDQENSNIQKHRLGNSLTEEIAVCLLGGYGIPAEVGLAAFDTLNSYGLFETSSSEENIFEVLSQPLKIGNRSIKYRFARQKSKYLSSALIKLSEEQIPENDALALRSWLMDFDGIGWKTASWITRNWLSSDLVAIIDIHIHRAGILMNLYDDKISPGKQYKEMEDKFLALAKGLNVRASQLDSLIWQEMRLAGNIVLRHIRSTTNH